MAGSSEEFQCNNGHCVSKLALCDGYDDCMDLSDETVPCGKNSSVYHTST